MHEVFSRPTDADVATAVGLETVVPGEIVESANGLVTARPGTAQVIAAQVADVSQADFVCIRAEDVTLEGSQRGDVSARNRWTGRVVDVQREGSVVRVTVDCGFSLSALITRPAYDELRLTQGVIVTAVVKATAVHLVPRGIP